MANYNFEPNESIILKSERVLHGEGRSAKYTDDLILTNQNIILISKGLNGSTKNTETYPVNQIKKYNGKAQVILGRNRALNPQLEVYFKDHQEIFGFLSKGEVEKWIVTINDLVTGSLSDENTRKLMAIPGTEIVATTLKDTYDTVMGVFGAKQKGNIKPLNVKVTIKCIGCGSPLSGIQGHSVRCHYCDTDQIL